MIQMGWSRMEESIAFNVDSTTVLAQAARRRNIRMIHVSTVDTLAPGTLEQPATETSGTTNKPLCSYVVSKTKAEQAFLAEVDRGLDGVVVNPGFMVGPYDWKPSSGAMMIAISNRFLYFVPAGGCCVVDVRDVAEGIISCIRHGRTGERYILGGENMSYLELWSLMTKVMNRPPPKKKLPAWLASPVGRIADVAGKLLRKELVVNGAAVAMGQLEHYYSSEKAKRELGYKIGSVQAALEDAWEWFQELRVRVRRISHSSFCIPCSVFFIPSELDKRNAFTADCTTGNHNSNDAFSYFES